MCACLWKCKRIWHPGAFTPIAFLPCIPPPRRALPLFPCSCICSSCQGKVVLSRTSTCSIIRDVYPSTPFLDSGAGLRDSEKGVSRLHCTNTASLFHSPSAFSLSSWKARNVCLYVVTWRQHKGYIEEWTALIHRDRRVSSIALATKAQNFVVVLSSSESTARVQMKAGT